ncbi:MAG: hypothetical protein DCF25_02465 [Leptolyngbya foveolarum]|uniref:Uncharacterized protein n=1 Tax=Leptolyngbya foveolarum TaxID=47253 RepID=A0A2W4UTT8_9CYAN|nr:MAG: hypothetical protein DCF25_02465 [Leptolyngbya foveolarum]
MAESVYSREQVEQWQTKLEAIASEPRTTFTKKQVVEELIDTIETALESRSYLEVANGLKDWGLDISEGSLKQYVSRYRKANKTKPVSLGKKRATKTSVLEGDEKSVQASVAADEPMKKKKATGGKQKGFVEMPEEL